MRGESDTGERYYEHWLTALERIVAAKRLLEADSLGDRQSAWRRAASRTPHGHPIVLHPDD